MSFIIVIYQVSSGKFSFTFLFCRFWTRSSSSLIIFILCGGCLAKIELILRLLNTVPYYWMSEKYFYFSLACKHQRINNKLWWQIEKLQTLTGDQEDDSLDITALISFKKRKFNRKTLFEETSPGLMKLFTFFSLF